MADFAMYLLPIAGIIVVLLIIAFGYVVHSGLFHTIRVTVGNPPIKDVTIAYKFLRGPYKDVGKVFQEICHLAPNRVSLGMYYDCPTEVPAHLTRSAIGVVLAKGKEEPSSVLKKSFSDKGYKLKKLPAVNNAMNTTFPFKNYLSILIAVRSVYPAFEKFEVEHKLMPHPYVEVYDGGQINFMGPLDNQEGFYVEETMKGDVILSATD